jgi:hypothetical protein
MSDFIPRLEVKVAEQLKAQRVVYLLGAGSSCLNGTGYPLAFEVKKNGRESLFYDRWRGVSEFHPLGHGPLLVSEITAI